VKERIYISRQHLLTMVLAAEEIFPKECFGFVLGQDNIVTDILPLQSVINKRDEVIFKPEKLLIFKSNIEQSRKGERVIGTFHSHPGADALLRPSPADKENLGFVPYLFIVWVPKHLSDAKLGCDGRWRLRHSVVAKVGVWKFKGKRLLRVKIEERG
jgi:proteasome lid subunit RPN8/RPN11